MNKPARPKQVFLSYATGDKAMAAGLARGLSNVGLQVWWDREVLPGENWAAEVGKALEESDAMVVLVSPEAVASRSVRREIEFALGSPRYAGRLIPVMVRKTKEMPWIFQKLHQVAPARTPAETSKRILKALAGSSAAA